MSGELGAEGYLGHPREVVRLAEALTGSDAELAPARIGNVHSLRSVGSLVSADDTKRCLIAETEA